MRLDAGKAIRDAMRGQRDWDAILMLAARIPWQPRYTLRPVTPEHAARLVAASIVGVTITPPPA